MTLFEYLTVAVSIVLSMGIIRLIDGLRPAWRAPARYWVHLIWVFIKIWSHAQYWWLLWGYREGTDWNFPFFLYLLVGPALLYMQVSMLLPPRPETISSIVRIICPRPNTADMTASTAWRRAVSSSPPKA